MRKNKKYKDVNKADSGSSSSSGTDDCTGCWVSGQAVLTQYSEQ